MAREDVDGHRPGRRESWLAALLFAAVLGVAMLPRLFEGDASASVRYRPMPDFLQRYDSDAGLAAICREPEILGEARDLCGLGDGARTASSSVPIPPVPPTRDIRFATEKPKPAPISTPAVDHWEIGFSQLPAVLLTDSGSGIAGFAGAISVSGGGGVPGLLILADSGGGSGGPPKVPSDCDPEQDPECDDDSDSEPPGPAVPEPTAAVLFGLGFAAILRRQSSLG